MDAINDWIWNNLLLAVALNITAGVLLAYFLVKPFYKFIRKQKASKNDWVAFSLAIAVGLIAFLITGLDSSPIKA